MNNRFSRTKTIQDSTQASNGYSATQLRAAVAALYKSLDENYLATAQNLGANVGVVWGLINGNRDDSPQIRERLNMPKRKSYKLAVTFADEAERDAFRRDCLSGRSFGEWVYRQWENGR